MSVTNIKTVVYKTDSCGQKIVINHIYKLKNINMKRHTEATDNKNLKKNPIKVPAAVSNEQQPACLRTVMLLRMGRVLMANHLSELISLSGIVPVQWT